DSQLRDVLMELQPRLKYARDRWMKAGHERRLFPAIWRDFRAYVSAGEPLRKQPVEQRVQLPVGESLGLRVHLSRFASSPAADQAVNCAGCSAGRLWVG